MTHTAAWQAAAGLAGSSGGRRRGVVERDAVELLWAEAEGVGLLRVRGDPLEVTSLRHAWSQIDGVPVSAALQLRY